MILLRLLPPKCGIPGMCTASGLVTVFPGSWRCARTFRFYLVFFLTHEAAEIPISKRSTVPDWQEIPRVRFLLRVVELNIELRSVLLGVKFSFSQCSSHLPLDKRL